jgi:cytoskeletal protein CcmA (bactofilin family)
VAAQSSATDKVLAGQDLIIPAGTTIDHDVYAFGNSVTVAGTINGDLVTAAARVVIDGTVTGDLLAAASEVALNGTIGGDARIGAAEINVLGTVSEDVASLSSTLAVGPNARIGGDLLFSATQATLAGTVTGSVSGSATTYQRGGSVGGTEEVSLPTRPDENPADRTIALALDAFRQFLLVILAGLALLRFAPRFHRAVIDRARSQPLMAAGAGVFVVLGVLASVVAVTVLTFLLAISFGELGFVGFVAIDLVGGGLVIVGLLFGLVVFSAFVADAIVASAIGRLVSVADGSRWSDVIRLIVGAALIVVVTSFPTVGSVVKLLVILLGLGAFAGVLWDARRRPVPTVIGPPAGV